MQRSPLSFNSTTSTAPARLTATSPTPLGQAHLRPSTRAYIQFFGAASLSFALIAGCQAPPSSDDGGPQHVSQPTEKAEVVQPEVVQSEVVEPEVDQSEIVQPEVSPPVPPQIEPIRVADSSLPRQIEEVVVTSAYDQSVAAPRVRLMSKGAAYKHGLSANAHPGIHPGYYPQADRDQYEQFNDNRWQWSAQQPVSTFAVDVDTASYANLRRSLEDGVLPAEDAVRVEELINYFTYDYPAPSGDHPFGIYQEFGPSPWDANTKLLHVGINTTPPQNVADLPPANLVFLVDVSGSMQAPNKIPLLKRSLKLLTKQLRAEDRIAIVVYAGAAGTVLESTSGADKPKILAAIDNLRAGGSTNGAAGIHLAYQIAQQHMIKDGINRVMLATDGDFNVGTTDTNALEKLVEAKRQSGVALTVLGFGSGNLNDHMMQKIAQIGDGNAAYIDTMHEARKVLVDELGATLNIVARDVKVQVEFNPSVVSGYRLIGYETRHLNREDFNNDKVDAGEVGEGHSVTALYEVTLVGDENGKVDPLRYATVQPETTIAAVKMNEAAQVKVRYKTEQGAQSQLVTKVVPTKSLIADLNNTSERFQFSGAVAWFGQMMRGNDAMQNNDWNALLALAQQAKGSDTLGYRSEFMKLVRTAYSLQPDLAATQTLKQ